MKDKKLERALYGPSLFEVTLGALLSVALGALGAVVFLIFKPVEVVKELPKEEERVAGMVYFVEGSKDTGKGRQWMRKRQLLLDGAPGEITFTEEELNAWFSAGAPAQAKPGAKPAAPKAPAPGGKAPEADAAPEEVMVVSVPNFRIQDNALQVGVPTTFNLLTLQLPVVVQTRGTFTKQGDIFMYDPSSVMVGSLPLHRIPGATAYLMKRAMSAQVLPEEGLAAWRKLSNVTVEGRVLKLTI